MSTHRVDQGRLRSRRGSWTDEKDQQIELKKTDHFPVSTKKPKSVQPAGAQNQYCSDETPTDAADDADSRSRSPRISPTPSLASDNVSRSLEEGQLANFGTVAPGIYRSAWPTANAFNFVKSLNLKTIVTLVLREDADTEYLNFIKANDIKHHVIDMKGTKKQSIPPEMMRSILQLILDKSNHPVLVHCNQGRHRTGCVMGVVRKMYGWDIKAMLSEYHSFAEPKPRETDISYLTTIDTAKLFSHGTEDAPFPRRGPFFRTLLFAFVGTAIWLFTGLRLGNTIDNSQS